MPQPAWPDRRADVIAGLERLASISLTHLNEWPDLTNAVHWLVDDTSWDERDPVSDVGLLLRDRGEANAVSAVLGPLLGVLDDLGPIASDERYLAQPRWADVAAAARAASVILLRADQTST